MKKGYQATKTLKAIRNDNKREMSNGKISLIQAYIIFCVISSLAYTAAFYSYFIELEPLMLQELMRIILTITTTIFGFFGALMILVVQLFKRTYFEQRRIRFDSWYKLVELSRQKSSEPAYSEIKKILNDNEVDIEETQEAEKYFKKFCKIVIGVFAVTIIWQIMSYFSYSSHVSSVGIYILGWTVLMATVASFYGFGFLLFWIILR